MFILPYLHLLKKAKIIIINICRFDILRHLYMLQWRCNFNLGGIILAVKVFVVDKTWEADVKAWIVRDRREAQMVVYPVKESWDAQTRIFLVPKKQDADLKIFMAKSVTEV